MRREPNANVLGEKVVKGGGYRLNGLSHLSHGVTVQDVRGRVVLREMRATSKLS
jgi:hypothetical protein